MGVGHDPQRGAAYVENWVKLLEEDPREITALLLKPAYERLSDRSGSRPALLADARACKARKEIGKPDLEPGSAMVFSLARKAIFSGAGLLRDGPSYLFQGFLTAR